MVGMSKVSGYTSLTPMIHALISGNHISLGLETPLEVISIPPPLPISLAPRLIHRIPPNVQTSAARRHLTTPTINFVFRFQIGTGPVVRR